MNDCPQGTFVKLDDILTLLRERKISFLEKMDIANKDGMFTYSAILSTQLQVLNDLLYDFESLKS